VNNSFNLANADDYVSNAGMLENATKSPMKKTLVVVGDYWCPYNCWPGTDYPGFMIEILQKALAPHGIAIDYRLMSWSKAVEEVTSDKIQAIVGISDPAARGLLHIAEPLAFSTLHAFTKKGINWKYDGTDSLIGKKIGLVMDYQLNEALSHYLGTYYYTTRPDMFVFEDGQEAVINNINHLIDGTIDVYIEDVRVVNYYLNRAKFENYIQDSGNVPSSKLPLYIAFSKNLPHAQEYIKYIDHAIKSMIESGEYESLKAKYYIDLEY
jgi:polar amino acid transport system substrate-binding protein